MATNRPIGSMGYRKDRGKWFVRFPTGGKTKAGRTAYKVELFDTEEQAQTVLEQAREAAVAGTLVMDAPKALTVVEAIKEYMDANRERLAEKTLESYRGTRRTIGAEGSPLRDVLAEDLAEDSIQSYRAWRKEHVFRVICPPGGTPKVEHRAGKTARPSTINRDTTLISAAVRRLVDLGRVPASVLKRVKAVKKATERKGSKRVSLSPDEAVRLLAAADDDFRPLLLTALHTGARKDEIVSLQWGDLTLPPKPEDGEPDGEGTVRIRRSKTQNESVIPLTPELMVALRTLKDDNARRNRRIPAMTAHVFTNRLGNPWKNIRNAWKRAIKNAGLDGKTGLVFHSCRHTFASNWPGSLHELKEILGHADIQTTMRYLHVRDDSLRSAMRSFNYGVGPADDAAPDAARATSSRG